MPKPCRKDCRVDFKLHKICVGTLLGIGGCTIDKLICFNLERNQKTTPTILVLEMGSNDLCDLSCHPQIISPTIMAFTELFAFEMNRQHTVICKVIERKTPHFPDYEWVKELKPHVTPCSRDGTTCDIMASSGPVKSGYLRNLSSRWYTS